jgi:serine protease Do
MGTGFFISSSGYAVTSRHVVEGGIDPMAQLNDQSEYPIRVLAKSLQHDLALLLVLGPGQSPHLTLRNPRTLVPGERLFAIGTSAGLQATITDGIFTGFRKIKATDERVIQFSAPINPGNSGGPLIDEKGRVVGIVTWKFVKKKGIPVSGVGFAVPSGHITEEYGIYLE